MDPIAGLAAASLAGVPSGPGPGSASMGASRSGRATWTAHHRSQPAARSAKTYRPAGQRVGAGAASEPAAERGSDAPGPGARLAPGPWPARGPNRAPRMEGSSGAIVRSRMAVRPAPPPAASRRQALGRASAGGRSDPVQGLQYPRASTTGPSRTTGIAGSAGPVARFTGSTLLHVRTSPADPELAAIHPPAERVLAMGAEVGEHVRARRTAQPRMLLAPPARTMTQRATVPSHGLSRAPTRNSRDQPGPGDWPAIAARDPDRRRPTDEVVVERRALALADRRADEARGAARGGALEFAAGRAVAAGRTFGTDRVGHGSSGAIRGGWPIRARRVQTGEPGTGSPVWLGRPSRSCPATTPRRDTPCGPSRS